MKSLRAKNYQGSDDEWVQILSYVLRQSPPSDHDATWTTGLEVTASIRGEGDEDKELVILIRKRIDTITVCHLFTRIASFGLGESPV